MLSQFCNTLCYSLLETSDISKSLEISRCDITGLLSGFEARLWLWPLTIFCRLTTSDRRIAVKRGTRDMSTTACDSWRQLLPPTNSRQATAVRAAAKRDSTGRWPWLTPFRDCAGSAACRGGWGRLSNPQLSQWDEEISRLTALVARKPIRFLANVSSIICPLTRS